MTDLEKAAQLALEALEEIHRGNMTPMAEEAWNKAITALRQALEQQPSYCSETETLCRKCRGSCEALEQQPADEPVGTAGELFTNAALERLDFRPSTPIYARPQPADEPVAYGYWNERLGWYGLSLQPGGSYTEPDRRPLYTRPQPAAWVSLTDEEIYDMYNEPRSDSEMLEFAREIEAALRSKNT